MNLSDDVRQSRMDACPASWLRERARKETGTRCQQEGWCDAVMQTPPWWSEVDVTSHQPEGPIWCPVAHMVRARPYGPGSTETKHGSRHFAAGAKLYVHRYVGYK